MNRDVLISYWWRLQDDRESLMDELEGNIDYWEKVAENEKKWENLNIIRCIIDELRMSENKG
jgi:hypothetical protein